MLEPVLEKKPVVYVTRDIERALGLPLNTKGYYIISNFTPFVKSISGRQNNVLLIKEARLLDTYELLNHPQTKDFLSKITAPNILVFKNTKAIENICENNHWHLINPKSELANLVEEKISQVKWLGQLKKFLPPHEVKTLKQITWPKFARHGNKLLPFILQFNRAHTGSGTYLIQTEEELNDLKTKFPDRLARVTEYIAGPMFTNNNVVWGKEVLVGNINYQITGLRPFTLNTFATIGNDWALPHKLLTPQKIKQYQKMANTIGEHLAKKGWQGLFGIDVILNPKNNRLYLIEINARQPASTTYESMLQDEEITKKNVSLLTTFAAHILSLLKEKNMQQKVAAISNGAQIIQKVIKKMPSAKGIFNKLTEANLKYFTYTNTKNESDWLRIQSTTGLFSNHNKLNSLGKKIQTILNKSL